MKPGRLVAVALAICLVVGTTGPALAYVFLGWYNSSEIDTNGNGQADLSICYGVHLSDAVYVNRGEVQLEIEQWHTASYGSFSSNGSCGNDNSSVQMYYANFGTCEPGVPSVLGATNNPGNVGYSIRYIWFNSQCLDDFDWYDADGIDAGKYSALATALHEVGHALGLNHSGVSGAVMAGGGPAHCSAYEHDWRLAADDAAGYRVRYPGINDTGTSFPALAGCDN
jgi:hypothetical protein